MKEQRNLKGDATGDAQKDTADEQRKCGAANDTTVQVPKKIRCNTRLPHRPLRLQSGVAELTPSI